MVEQTEEMHLLHMTKDVFSAVEHTLAFFRIQVEDKVSGVVCVALLISKTKTEEQMRQEP